MFREGSRRVTGILRLSGGALAKLAHHQPDRIDVCDDPSSHASLERVLKPKGDAVHDVQARSVCATQLAQVARIQATRQSD